MKKALLVGASLAGIAAASSAAGQTPSTIATQSDVETVIVTAQRRSEDIQDVPLSVTAASGDELRALNVDDLQDLRAIDGALNFRSYVSPLSSAISLRGVGTASYSSGVEQSVSTVLDGVVLGDPSAVAILADIQQVEILKGPQGTLFGKNASSGVISITTNRPTFDGMSGSVQVGGGTEGAFNAQGILNLPLSDTVSTRFVAAHNHQDGWVRATAQGGRRLNPIDISSFSGKLLWEPTDDLDVMLNGMFAYTDAYCCSSTTRSVVNPNSAAAISNAEFGVVPGPSNFDVSSDAPSIGYGRLQNLSLTVNHDVSGFDLVSITAYNRSQRSNYYDADQSYFDFVNQNGTVIDFKAFSQEFRLASPTDKAFDYVVGLYYGYQDNEGLIFSTGTFRSPLPGTLTLPPSAFVGTTGYESITSGHNFSAFGQAAFHISDTLTLRAGLRLIRDEISLKYRAGNIRDRSLPLPGGVPAAVTPPAVPPYATYNYVGMTEPFVTPCYTQTDPAVTSGTRRPNCFPGINQSQEEDAVSWRVTIDNRFSDDVMGYATVTRGYKGPGYSGLALTGVALDTGATDQSVGPEIPMSYEVGLKATLLDGALTVNGALFQTDYEDFQAQITSPISTSGSAFISAVKNAGTVNTRGIEISMSGRLNEDLSINFNALYLDAEYGDFAGVPCWTHYSSTPPYAVSAVQPGCGASPNVPGTVNARGNRLANAPEFQYTIAGSYFMPNLFGDLDASLELNWNWQSDVNFNPNGDSETVQEAYGVLGGQFSVGPPSNSWRLTFYGINVLDENWTSLISPFPAQNLNPGGYQHYFSPKSFSQFGARLQVNF